MSGRSKAKKSSGKAAKPLSMNYEAIRKRDYRAMQGEVGRKALVKTAEKKRAELILLGAYKCNLEGKALWVALSWDEGASLFKPWTWVLNLRWDRFFHSLKS